MRLVLLGLFSILFAAAAAGADSNRIIALEQDVRNLERQVANLEREVRELRRHPRGNASQRPATADAIEPESDAWVDAAKWNQLRLGTSEMEVIEILGRPTSMRVEGGARLLLYAMEIGGSGFLSGSVTLKDGEVIKIETPTLK